MKDLNTYYLTENKYIAVFNQAENMCKIYFDDGDFSNYFYFDDLKEAKTQLAELDDGLHGKIIKKLGEYDSIEKCVSMHFPEHTMPNASDLFEKEDVHMFFLTNGNTIVELYHTTDGDEAHPFHNGYIPGNYIKHDELLGQGSISVKTSDEIRRRLSEALYDKMQVEDKYELRAYPREVYPDGKIVSFPGVLDGIHLRYSDREFANLERGDLFGYGHFHGRHDLTLMGTLKFCEENNIKIDDILLYKEVGDGLVLLEDCKLKELHDENLNTISENDKEIYFDEAINLVNAYERDDVLVFSVYDTKGNIDFSEIDYDGKLSAQNTIDDAKCYLGEYDNIDDCMDDWKDILKKEEQKEREQNKDKDDELVR